MSESLPANYLRAMHRPPALRHANYNTPRAEIPRPEPAQHAPALAGDSGGEAPGASRPLLRFTLRRCGMLDWDAKHGSLKDTIDGLVASGILHGDREDQIDPQSSVTQERVRHRADEEIVIEVIYH